MKLFFIFFTGIMLLQSCTSTEVSSPGIKKHLTYQNIVILSDLSDRISNSKFPTKDSVEIHKLVQYFKNDCVKPGEKIGDKSSIYFATFSDNRLTSIDIDDIKSLADKQSFINSTGKYKQSGLEQKLHAFEDTVSNRYHTVSNFGLDLLSIFLEKIANDNIIKKNKIITDGIDTTFIHYENQVYILSDGYLEYSLKTKNDQFRFGPPKIDAVRSYCERNHVNLEKAFEQHADLCLPPIKREIHQLANIHILETQERDFNTKTHDYDNPVGLRDNEILEAVWKKWMTESGFGSFEWRKY